MTDRKFSKGRAAKLAAAPILLATVAACATPFKADVSRFATTLPAPQGQTFAVVADDPALAGGLEFAQYADFVEAEMAQLGYTQAASPETANLLVRFDYDVDNGRERVRTTPGFYDPFYSSWYGYTPYRYSRLGYRHRGYRGRYGFRGGPWAYGFYDPFFRGYGADVRSYTIYTSEIDVKIDDTATGERLFEGSAEAVSRSNRLQYLVPNLVDAMFTDFPGNSGETVRISIAEEDRSKTVRRID